MGDGGLADVEPRCQCALRFTGQAYRPHLVFRELGVVV